MMFIESLHHLVHHFAPSKSEQVDVIEKFSDRVGAGSIYLRAPEYLDVEAVLNVFAPRTHVKKVRAISLLHEPHRLLDLSNRRVPQAWLSLQEVMEHHRACQCFGPIHALMQAEEHPFWGYWADTTACRYPNLEKLFVHVDTADDLPKKSVDTLLRDLYGAAILNVSCWLAGGQPLLHPLEYLNVLENCLPVGPVDDALVVLCA